MPTTSDNDSWSGDSDAAHVDVDISTHLVELGTPTSRLANATARARVFQYLDGDHQAALALLRDESRALTQQGLRDPDVLNRLRVSQAVALGYAGYSATAHRALSSLVESAGFSASALEAVAP